MELRLRYPPTPEHARDLADVCVEVARSVSGLELDYSIESLSEVDKQLDKFHRQGLKSDEIASTLFCFGCYVGEVVVRHFGGRWIWLKDSLLRRFGGPPIVVILNSKSSWNPIGKVFRRVDEGESESIPYFFRVIAAQNERAIK